MIQTTECDKNEQDIQNNWRAPWKNGTSRYISFFSAHHSMAFYFRYSPSPKWPILCQVGR